MNQHHTTNPPAAIARAVHRTPVGELHIAADRHGVRAVAWAPHTLGPVTVTDAFVAEPDEPDELVARTITQLEEYFAGERTDFELPLAPAGTPFQRAAWAVLRTIPFGDTMSYGAQARALGDPNKARAVGAANGRNPLAIIVPCHRVRGADGRLTGFGGGIENKAWLLDHERLVLLGGAGPG